ncbi:hypothetical protein ABZ901_24055 [Actinacidiphila alni]|uniref:hypothetical protein n=1 Tax=Actinacidiphila alni TaxID=380248 RepID=UPI0033D92503
MTGFGVTGRCVVGLGAGFVVVTTGSGASVVVGGALVGAVVGGAVVGASVVGSTVSTTLGVGDVLAATTSPEAPSSFPELPPPHPTASTASTTAPTAAPARTRIPPGVRRPPLDLPESTMPSLSPLLDAARYPPDTYAGTYLTTDGCSGMYADRN